MLYKYKGIPYSTIYVEALSLYDALGKIHDLFKKDIDGDLYWTPFTSGIEGYDITRKEWEKYDLESNLEDLDTFLEELHEFINEWYRISNWEEVPDGIALTIHN